MIEMGIGYQEMVAVLHHDEVKLLPLDILLFHAGFEGFIDSVVAIMVMSIPRVCPSICVCDSWSRKTTDRMVGAA